MPWPWPTTIPATSVTKPSAKPCSTSTVPASPGLAVGAILAEAHKPLWIERKGVRIAVLSYNEFKPRSFEAGANWPGIAWSEDDHVISDIRAAKAAGADLVIPFMHWGWEKETTPSQRQRQLAHKMIDEGATLVVGGHPHVTQGAETYKGKPIIYSLGNFVFDGFDYAKTANAAGCSASSSTSPA
jgi:poly-gamma-glutamate capsule biosynthesis protein CapA/YwtB (metallophosphatase superfamily)